MSYINLKIFIFMKARAKMGKIVLWLETVMVSALLLGLSACHTTSEKDIVPPVAFAPYVSAYTGGVISQMSAIRIELAEELPMVDLNAEPEDAFSFSPSLKGKARWVSNSVIEFVPEQGQLKSGRFYEGTFNLGNFLTVDKELQEFHFSFRVQKPDFSMQTASALISARNPDEVSVSGLLCFSDVTSASVARNILTACGYGGKSVDVEVTPTSDLSRYEFALSGLPRVDEDYELIIKADGSSADIGRKIEQRVLIPAKGQFRFLSARRMEQPDNGIEAVFSSPVSQIQDLNGLIEVPEQPVTSMQVKDNKVCVYFDTAETRKLTFKIHMGLQDTDGRTLSEPQILSFGELNLKPQVTVTAGAAILPDAGHLTLPFRAVNLHAVDLSIIRIFEHNVLSFLQSNTLQSNGELRRCGRLVYKKTLWLGDDKSKDLHRWEDYSVDLGGLIRQEPGAIYRVLLSFRQEYSAYPCGGSDTDVRYASPDGLRPVDDSVLTEEEQAEWDVPQAYYYYTGTQEMDWSRYDWKERDNPCHPSYYMNTSLVAACNVLASDLGVTVKGNVLNTLWVAVNRITTTQPVKGARVTAYNYQLQPVGQAVTDRYGFAEISASGNPFLVMAEYDTDKGYVRVVDGEALSVSRFDVGGKEMKKGLKGFVYGERGVWRPGDTLHVAFMLDDRKGRIPDKHPVTLELYNPMGQFYAKQIATDGLNGLYVFHLPTTADDPTGTWNAYVKVGGATFHKSLRIETIKPNRLKINLRLPEEILQKDAVSPVELSASWLTGASAGGLKAKVEYTLSQVRTQFKDYPSYQFNNPALEFPTSTFKAFDGQLDNEGCATVNLEASKAFSAPGKLNALFTTRVFEPGGDASVYTQTVPYSVYPVYVGIDLHQSQGKFLETDREHTFSVVTLDEKGRPVDTADLEYSIYKIDWNWWWENRSENFGSYVNSKSVQPLVCRPLKTSGGKAEFAFKVEYPDWGRYLVYVKDRKHGHATGGVIYVDWPEWRGRFAKTMPDGITMLSFSLDKASYEIGDEATAIIPAAPGGRALVSLENGSEVLKREWIEMDGGKDTKYSFRITPDMAPNVYLNICLLQPYAQTVNDLPVRMYGIMPVPVVSRETVLHPRVNLPEVLRPETEFSVTVDEKNGRPMTYTLAIVDEGLLDLTNFKTPDPWNEFYAREALGVRTWDMYDYVLGATAGMYSPLFSIGGDETLKQADAKANRFKPVVKYVGPFKLDAGKRNIHKLKLPMYVGAVRVMVVAGQDGAYGNAEATSVVRSPLMLLSTLPRVVSIQEEITVPVNVFALEKGVRNVRVSMHVEGGLQAVDGTYRTLSFNQTGDTLVYFRLKTGKTTGKAVLSFTAEGGGQQAREKVEIDIRNPNPEVTLTEDRWLEKDECTTLSCLKAGASDANWKLEVSRIPCVQVERQLDFLSGYVHQCTEQLTSKALPLLFVGSFREIDAEENARIRTLVEEGIRQLYSRQLPNGGFIYWPGNAVADEWITSYVGMFLTLAQESGYAVSSQVLGRWTNFQRSAARNWTMPVGQTDAVRYVSSVQQAYRLYTLALADAAEQGAMNRMKERNDLSPQALWWLSASYALAGKAQIAGELVYKAQSGEWPHNMSHLSYGSPERDEAIILEALLLAGRRQEALAQAQKVTRLFASRQCFDTQSSAFVLMAMRRLATEQTGTLRFSWQYGGKEQPEVDTSKAMFVTALPPEGYASGKEVTITNRTDAPLHVGLSARLQLLNDTLPTLSDGLRLSVKYTDVSGHPIDVNTLVQGSDIVAVLTVTNLSSTTDYSDLALTYILPSGWEIYGGNASTAAPGNFRYQDVRDDRVLTYFALSKGAEVSFSLRLQATYMGNFVLPAVQCESMYNTAVRARTKAGRTTVTSLPR